MMGSDARDMMGLPSAAPAKSTPVKASKPKIKAPTGMSREVMDLNYEGAPPISIVAPKFKDKPKLPFKPRAWEETPFRNSARTDGLILKHWRRKGDSANGGQLPVTPADSNAASEMDQDDKTSTIPDAHWVKYNVRVPRPQYSDEEYDEHMKSEDWSKEETNYLVNLAIDFDLRWIVVSDRYDYKPPETTKENEDPLMAAAPQAKLRTQEDMKARYYTVAAKSMALRVGVENMSATEFDMHEKMLKFSPLQETRRKAYAEQLLARTEEEKRDEEFLLKELSRIVINQEKLQNDRKALYDRLDAPKTTPNDTYSTTMYQSSQGLTQLMQTMHSQNKQKDAQRKEKRQSGLQEEYDRQRPAHADHNKRSSLGGNSQTASQQRHLNPRDQTRFGAAYPTNERLVGGVNFRNERAVKAAQAKSTVQTTRISAALSELGVPVRLTMPTFRVVSDYERVIENIKGLLEVRKLREKVDGEVKVWKAQKEAAEARERGEEVEEKRDEPKEENKEGTQEVETKKEDSAEHETGQEESRIREMDEDRGDNAQEDDAHAETTNKANEEEPENETADEDAAGEAEDEEKEEDDEAAEEDGDGDEEDPDAEAEADDEEVYVETTELGDGDQDADVEGDEEEDDDVDDDGEGEEVEEEEEEEEEEEGEDNDEDGQEGGEVEPDEIEDEPSPAPTARSTRKRSASVNSGVSSKRQKK